MPQHNHVTQYPIPTGKLFFSPHFLHLPGFSWGAAPVLPMHPLSSTKASSQLILNTPTSTRGCEVPHHLPWPSQASSPAWNCSIKDHYQDFSTLGVHMLSVGSGHDPAPSGNASSVQKSWAMGCQSNNPKKLTAAETKEVKRQQRVWDIHTTETPKFIESHTRFFQAVGEGLTSPIAWKRREINGVAFLPITWWVLSWWKHVIHSFSFQVPAVSLGIWEEKVLFFLIRKEAKHFSKIEFRKQ